MSFANQRAALPTTTVAEFGSVPSAPWAVVAEWLRFNILRLAYGEAALRTGRLMVAEVAAAKKIRLAYASITDFFV